MHYLDIAIAVVIIALEVALFGAIWFFSFKTKIPVEHFFRVAAQRAYGQPNLMRNYLLFCMGYLFGGLAMLFFGMFYTGLALLVTAAISSYSTVYFFVLHRSLRRGIALF